MTTIDNVALQGDHSADSEKSALYERVSHYGTRGIVEVASAEGVPISQEDLQFLAPAG